MPPRSAKNASPSGGVKIPLNDDDAEKVKRVKKRSMLQEVQIARRQSAAFAATPRKGLDGGDTSTAEGTPKTPRNPALRESINPITPLRRPVLLVNFEEWMKMANDNVCSSNIQFFFLFPPPQAQALLIHFSLIKLENQCTKQLELCPYRLFP